MVLESFEEGFELALAADKYLLLPLKEKCLAHVQAIVGPSSVWRALRLAQLLQHQPLLQACIKVRVTVSTTVVSLFTWRKLLLYALNIDLIYVGIF